MPTGLNNLGWLLQQGHNAAHSLTCPSLPDWRRGQRSRRAHLQTFKAEKRTVENLQCSQKTKQLTSAGISGYFAFVFSSVVPSTRATTITPILQLRLLVLAIHSTRNGVENRKNSFSKAGIFY